MNHDTVLSSPAQAGGPSQPDGSDADDTYERSLDETRPRDSAGPGGRRRRRKKLLKKLTPGLKKKLTFVTHLLKGLDTVVFAELSALYYMEYGKSVLLCLPM